MIRPMKSNTANLKARYAIKIKIVGNTRNRTRQTHCRATIICPTKVGIKARYTMIIRTIIKGTLSDYFQN